MLLDFLIEHEKEVLAMTETKSLQLAGVRPSSDQLKQGFPIFYHQLKRVLRAEQASYANASDNPGEAELARTAGLHGIELQRLSVIDTALNLMKSGYEKTTKQARKQGSLQNET
jgi:hypothetical protein